MGYRYFKPNEIISLDPELVYILDSARDIAGIPFIISSGYRTPEQNKAVGGVENSAHLEGKAADILCKNSTERHKIVEALLDMGCRRIGVAKDHVHVDISEVLPQPVLFIEYA